MNREEEIINAGIDYMIAKSPAYMVDSSLMGEYRRLNRSRAFEAGARWADAHPKSKYELSNPDQIELYLQSIIKNCEILTSGNVAHYRASIIGHAKMALSCINESKCNYYGKVKSI